MGRPEIFKGLDLARLVHKIMLSTGLPTSHFAAAHFESTGGSSQNSCAVLILLWHCGRTASIMQDVVGM